MRTQHYLFYLLSINIHYNSVYCFLIKLPGYANMHIDCLFTHSAVFEYSDILKCRVGHERISLSFNTEENYHIKGNLTTPIRSLGYGNLTAFCVEVRGNQLISFNTAASPEKSDTFVSTYHLKVIIKFISVLA